MRKLHYVWLCRNEGILLGFHNICSHLNSKLECFDLQIFVGLYRSPWHNWTGDIYSRTYSTKDCISASLCNMNHICHHDTNLQYKVCYCTYRIILLTPSFWPQRSDQLVEAHKANLNINPTRYTSFCRKSWIYKHLRSFSFLLVN